MYEEKILRKRPELNERQKKFVDFYLQSANATESARKAGYLIGGMPFTFFHTENKKYAGGLLWRGRK